MTFVDFQNTFRQSGVVEWGEIQKAFPKLHPRRLNEWQQKGYLQKIINRFYGWTDDPLTEQRLYYSANRIYRPSYISHWTALSYYGLIPEGVFQIYSVSTLKTQRFETPLGIFTYQHIKPNLFFGYRIEQWQNKPLLIAEPEKALLDTFYLNQHWKDQKDVEALRLNDDIWQEVVDDAKVSEYAQYYNKRVQKLTAILLSLFNHA